jgi:hypothetical protein
VGDGDQDDMYDKRTFTNHKNNSLPVVAKHSGFINGLPVFHSSLICSILDLLIFRPLAIKNLTLLDPSIEHDVAASSTSSSNKIDDRDIA